MKSIKYSETRRQTAVVGPWNTMVINNRNPYTVTFWSMACAGLGQILLDRYFRGFILLIGEIFLNYLANLNYAIFYTITGQYALAKEVININALLLYLGIYCFSIFDSYRDTVVINNAYRLADRENAKITCFAANKTGFTILQNVSPYIALIWSAILPGAGCFVLQRMNRAMYLLALWSVNAYFAGFYSAVFFTVSGHYELAKESLNIQWLLNLPSIWLFSMFESYNCALENNKVHKRELSNFLTEEYRRTCFNLSDVLKEV